MNNGNGTGHSDPPSNGDRLATRVLLVDLARDLAGRLQRRLTTAGFTTDVVKDDQEALQAVSTSSPQDATILLTPQSERFELIETLRATRPSALIVVITDQDRDRLTSAALARGAVGYIPRCRLEHNLLHMLKNVTGLAIRQKQRHRDLMEAWFRTSAEFVLDNRPATVSALIGYVRETLQLLRFGDHGTIIRTCVALTEALDNAVYHGNLEIDSKLRKDEDGGAWDATVAQRRELSPYKDRNLFVRTELSRQEVLISIRDEGPGFDPTCLPDPTDPENIEQVCGRGVFLVRSFMDEVRYNDKGNEITLIKRVAEGTIPDGVD